MVLCCYAVNAWSMLEKNQGEWSNDFPLWMCGEIGRTA